MNKILLSYAFKGVCVYERASVCVSRESTSGRGDVNEGGESRHNIPTSIEVNNKQADFQFILWPFLAVILPLWGERADHLYPIGLFNKKKPLPNKTYEIRHLFCTACFL